MSLSRTFLLSVLIGVIGVVGLAFASRDPVRMAGQRAAPVAHSLSRHVDVRDQITIAEIGRLKADGYRAIISLRPDGEAADQPPSEAVRRAAEAEGLSFAYIPTPRSTIPDATVDELSRVLATADGPVLLYCRSGSRAARAWALAEASRQGGSSMPAIIEAVRGAGQRVDDLLPRIEARLAAR
ncbi:MAG: TIGR01244 family sulfur transferase [Hyphomicrobiaceae bacterium]|nr:TIGR01244 family sulfur transferase [Hyphomicrobiaceae bacterium]